MAMFYKVFYKGRCSHCGKDINGNNYIWIPHKKTLVHRECYEKYMEEIKSIEEDLKEDTLND